MKINKKRLVATVATGLLAANGINATQVAAVINRLFSVLAAHRPSRVLELLESEEDKRRDKEE